nr:calmodulin-binding receptor-like cytoplasmic kinase 3 [Quercus suber]
MDIIVLSLLLLVQLPRIFASEFVQSKVCGTDNIAYSNSNGHELFYINGDAVNEDLFCEALQFYHASGCIFDGYLGSNHCEVDLSLDGLVFKAGRKLFQRNLKEKSKSHDRHRHHMSNPTIAGMATTGAFVLCCVFLCACFQKRKKPTSHTVLSKDPHSIDSASSFDVNPAPEKIPASPHRMPIPPTLKRFKVHALNDLAEHDVLSGGSLDLGDAYEEMRFVDYETNIGHGEDSGANVLLHEVLVGKLGVVDRLASDAVSGSEVASLAHKPRDHVVERQSLVVERPVLFSPV